LDPTATPSLALPDEPATVALALRFAPYVADGGVLYLRGELGAGKTTFARALLRALGVGERVKSPTYSLLERYLVNGRDAFHLDLYRIADAGELEWLGLDELEGAHAIVLVEWPERGRGALPAADFEVVLEHDGGSRRGRLLPVSARGRAWWTAMQAPEIGRR
jgi:tRNA threonylcarbamoyladenosine biosynthesis protein TsaE